MSLKLTDKGKQLYEATHDVLPDDLNKIVIGVFLVHEGVPPAKLIEDLLYNQGLIEEE